MTVARPLRVHDAGKDFVRDQQMASFSGITLRRHLRSRTVGRPGFLAAQIRLPAGHALDFDPA